MSEPWGVKKGPAAMDGERAEASTSAEFDLLYARAVGLMQEGQWRDAEETVAALERRYPTLAAVHELRQSLRLRLSAEESWKEAVRRRRLWSPLRLLSDRALNELEERYPDWRERDKPREVLALYLAAMGRWLSDGGRAFGSWLWRLAVRVAAELRRRLPDAAQRKRLLGAVVYGIAVAGRWLFRAGRWLAVAFWKLARRAVPAAVRGLLATARWLALGLRARWVRTLAIVNLVLYLLLGALWLLDRFVVEAH